MTSRFQDKFERADGSIGSNYTVACGGVVITDEAVVPIDMAVISGQSPLFPSNATALKTQVLYTAEAVDGPDYTVRGTWAHDAATPSSPDPATVETDSSFTILARMSKDPLLFDLGTDEDPNCYDQGYGARVTCPRDGTAPVLKIIKFMPSKRIPTLSRPSSIEIDGMVVLTSVTLDPDDLNLDPDFDASTYSVGEILPYRGFWQDMRLRIRRGDDQVILEVYLNDRNLNQPKITYTDKVDPLWGEAGLPGFEFMSGRLVTQPAGVSPFSLAGLSLMRCGIFSVGTFREVLRPGRLEPNAYWTYQRVTNRVILLVEKNGDAQYSFTPNATTKFNTYLDFVLEAEMDIIREEGYYEWLNREQNIYLIDGQAAYELPEDFSELDFIRPGNWNNGPLKEVKAWELFMALGSATGSGSAQPHTFYRGAQGPDDRPTITLFPTPSFEADPTEEDPFLVVHYTAKMLRPDEPDVQIPFCPQSDIDVLIYGAAAHALLLDTDNDNAQRMAAAFSKKSRDLRRKNNRKQSSRRTIARSAADTITPESTHRIPLLRHQQFGLF